MRKHLGLLVAGVLGAGLVVFVAPILIGLHRVVGDRSPLAMSRSDEHAVWLLFAVLSVGMVVAGYLLVNYQSRRLTRSMDKVQEIAKRYGHGESFEPLAPTGIEEIDQLARSLHDSAFRVTGEILLERQFSADVSHQLRTPLTSLQLKLDALDPMRWSAEEMQPIRNDLMQMERTIEHLLASVASRGQLLPLGK